MTRVEGTTDAAEETEDVLLILLTGENLRHLERGVTVKVGDVLLRVDFSDEQH
jgi:hypothetical protein